MTSNVEGHGAEGEESSGGFPSSDEILGPGSDTHCHHSHSPLIGQDRLRGSTQPGGQRYSESSQTLRNWGALVMFGKQL